MSGSMADYLRVVTPDIPPDLVSLETLSHIQTGDRILDAGCGFCGPSIDLAQSIPDIIIDAITLSSSQANTAKELVQQAGLADKIRVYIGDFHHLPFENDVFDVVFFLESAGYSYNQKRLFSEAYRVLRPEGRLYIKDVFCREPPLSDREQQELQEFNQVYVYKTTRMSETTENLSSVGFQNILSRDISEIFSAREFNKAMVEYKQGFPVLTEFGEFHYRQIQTLPILFGEIQARKPK